jgi:hypothetical protein
VLPANSLAIGQDLSNQKKKPIATQPSLNKRPLSEFSEAKAENDFLVKREKLDNKLFVKSRNRSGPMTAANKVPDLKFNKEKAPISKPSPGPILQRLRTV